MPKHKTRNTFYWITWEVKKIVSSKTSTKSAAWKLPPGSFAFAKNEAQSLLENEIFEAIHLY